MSEIKIQCVDQVLHLVETPPIFSGDVNYDTVTFEFDPSWDGFAKTAIFYRSKDNVFYLLLDNDNKCKVPTEVLTSKGVIYIGLVGAKDDTVITSELVRYRISEGAITEDTSTPYPTPDIFEQLLSDYAEIKTITGDMVAEHEARIKEAVDAKDKCLGAVSALNLEYYDMDGGDPFTKDEEYDNDVNGGYPT